MFAHVNAIFEYNIRSYRLPSFHGSFEYQLKSREFHASGPSQHASPFTV